MWGVEGYERKLETVARAGWKYLTSNLYCWKSFMSTARKSQSNALKLLIWKAEQEEA